jgi:soluble lytic murein transglycosylase-like protein
MDTREILVLIGVVLLLLLVFPALFKKSSWGSLSAKEENLYGYIIRSVAARYGVPEKRLRAMIIAESSVEATATGAAGERGLLQLMPAALADVNRSYGLNFTWEDMYVPERNIEAGAAYLTLKYREAGSWDAATQCYNVGYGAWSLDNTKGSDYLSRIYDIEAGLA